MPRTCDCGRPIQARRAGTGLLAESAYPRATLRFTCEPIALDLKVAIVIHDELTESIIKSTGWLDLASGEIRNVEYEDYDVALLGTPADAEDYEFTSGILSNAGKDVEFHVQVDKYSGKYSVSANELLEIKVRAAKLFSGIDSQALLDRSAAAKPAKPARPGKAPR